MMKNRQVCKIYFLENFVRDHYNANQAYQYLRSIEFGYRRKDFLADYRQAMIKVNQEKVTAQLKSILYLKKRGGI